MQSPSPNCIITSVLHKIQPFSRKDIIRNIHHRHFSFAKCLVRLPMYLVTPPKPLISIPSNDWCNRDKLQEGHWNLDPSSSTMATKVASVRTSLRKYCGIVKFQWLAQSILDFGFPNLCVYRNQYRYQSVWYRPAIPQCTKLHWSTGRVPFLKTCDYLHAFWQEGRHWIVQSCKT